MADDPALRVEDLEDARVYTRAHPAAIDRQMAGERVPGDDHVELQTLELVRRLDDDATESPIGQGDPQQVLLIVVGHPDRDPVGWQGDEFAMPLAPDPRAPLREATHEADITVF